MVVLKKFLLLLVTWPCLIAGAQPGSEQTAAMEWLKTSLDQYFAGHLSMEQVATVRYVRFKTDAMGMAFDGGMNTEAFEAKWGYSYDTKQPCLHEAFLIPLQDWNKVDVTCMPLCAAKQVLWIRVDFWEELSREHFCRHVKVVRENGNYRIDDVLEVPL